ncbi:golgin-45 [Gadus chalcogrammus]|uniref:golgin-45 n=1 Tax=Gadus chalcogrammus TaxID=1042646 RepID=UPI0024C4DECE|nr:golgin-45 [Gadus chalcogrammus]
MTTTGGVRGRAHVLVRGPGDGMETDKQSALLEVPTERVATPPPLETLVLKPACSLRPAPPPPGVLHLGQVSRAACAEVEVVRILVPRSAISRNCRVAPPPEGPEERRSPSPPPPVDDRSAAEEKLKNSERRLLQEKEGLINQLRVQTEVNRELKRLLVASVGDDLQYQFERASREKNHLVLENEALTGALRGTAEQLERMSIQGDVWRSKFLASRVMADELTNSRAALQRQNREAQGAIQDLLSERDQFSRGMVLTHGCLEELMVSLQWGRQQTYYPSTQGLTVGELASANQRLAHAISGHLLGNVGKSSGGASTTAHICNTPAEKMAEKVMKTLAPVSPPNSEEEPSFSDSAPTSFLANQKSIGRFHPYTRYENITFNCCERCSGDIIVL